MIVRVRCSSLCPTSRLCTLTTSNCCRGDISVCCSYLTIIRTADCCSAVGSLGGASVQAVRISDNIHQPLILWVPCSASSRAEYNIISRSVSRTSSRSTPTCIKSWHHHYTRTRYECICTRYLILRSSVLGATVTELDASTSSVLETLVPGTMLQYNSWSSKHNVHYLV